MLWDDDDDEETLSEQPRTSSHCRNDYLLSVSTSRFNISCLDALDDKLLASPRDCFADLCYATSTGDLDLRRRGPGYAAISSWQRALSPTSPSSRLPKLDGSDGDDSESDDERDLLTPVQSYSARDWSTDMLSASDMEDTRHVRFAEPPSLAHNGVFRIQAPVPMRKCANIDAEVALLFSSSPPPDPSHSVHFFPTRPDDSRRQGRLMKASAHIGSRIRHVASLRAGLSR